MNSTRTRRATELLGAVFVVLLFAMMAYLSIRYVDTLNALTTQIGLWSIPLYIAIGCVTTVVAPLSSTPLIPVAVAVWGPLVAAILTTLSWTLGSVFAFLLARRFGYRWVRRFASLHSVQRYASAMPERNLFLMVVLMRILVPADIVSYALGLFSSIRLVPYTTATLLGTMPFAFTVSYALRMPLWLQGVAAVLMAVSLFVGWRALQRSMRQQPDTQQTANVPHTADTTQY